MWSQDVEDADDARGLRKEDGDATTPRMSLRQRRRRSRHRAFLFLGACFALAVAFATLRSGLREHGGALDRIDGGVDGDYEAHAGEPFEDEASSKTRDGVRPGADPDSTVPTRASAESAAAAARDERGTSFDSTTRAGAIRATMRRGAVVKQHREAGDGDETEAGSETRSSPSSALGALFRLFGGGDAADVALAATHQTRRRHKARLHVTRDPSTGHLTMNDVGVGAFAVSQPRACAPIASEADGEADSVAGAMMALRTIFRVGKILRRCDAVSTTAFRATTDPNAFEDPEGGSAETLLRRLNAGTTYGPVCYTPDFLRGVASTLSVCSRNHEDGVVLALLGFAGLGRPAEAEPSRSVSSSFSQGARLLVSVSDAPAHAPERGASAYLVHNHFFRGAFLDKRAAAAAARDAHFRDRGVESRRRRGSGAAACVRGRVVPATIGDEIRGALAALEDALDPDAGRGERTTPRDGSGDDADDGTAIETFRDEKTSKKRARRRVEIDVLTLDVARDGLYLVQPALETVSPRLVVASYDSAFGPERALAAKPVSKTISAREPERAAAETDRASLSHRREGREGRSRGRGSFVGRDASDEASGAFFETEAEATEPEETDLAVTASLSAFSRALERWGFHFVGCEAAGETAFFLRSDVIEAANHAGRGSVHVTTPEDSGCFSAPATRLAMRRWLKIFEARVTKDGNAAFEEIDEDWLAAHAPGPPWRTDDAFLSNGAEEL